MNTWSNNRQCGYGNEQHGYRYELGVYGNELPYMQINHAVSISLFTHANEINGQWVSMDMFD